MSWLVTGFGSHPRETSGVGETCARARTVSCLGQRCLPGAQRSHRCVSAIAYCNHLCVTVGKRYGLFGPVSSPVKWDNSSAQQCVSRGCGLFTTQVHQPGVWVEVKGAADGRAGCGSGAPEPRLGDRDGEEGTDLRDQVTCQEERGPARVGAVPVP